MSYKYQRVRERLRQAVQNGELAGKLPGERELARRYSANAKTINKALTDLAIEGLLVRHVGRGTFVATAGNTSDNAPAPARACTFGYLVASEASNACSEALYERTKEVLHQRGHQLQELILDVGPSGELSGRKLRADTLRNFEGLVLCSVKPSEDLLAHVGRRHMPLVMISNHHPQVRTAAVLPDYAQGSFELCQHLIQLGHTRIQLLIDSALLPAAHAAESGYRAAMQRYQQEVRSTICLDGQAGAVITAMSAEKEPASAALCIGGGAVSKLLSVPGSAASQCVCCMLEPADTLAAEHGFTSYDVDPANVAHWITELLLSASPARWQRIVVVPGQLQTRASSIAPEHPADVRQPREGMF